MRVITLVENQSLSGHSLEGRFGLSLYIEHDGRKIVFDCGPDESCVSNAARLGIALDKLDAVVLSHAHRDHTGGLVSLLAQSGAVPVYLLSACVTPCYSRMPDQSVRFIGMEPSTVEQWSHCFNYVTQNRELFTGVHLLRPGNERKFWPKSNVTLLQQRADLTYELDDFRHEMMLVVTRGNEALLFTGCAHHGVINMLETARTRFPEIERWTLIGGFHLVNPRTLQIAEEPETVRRLASLLREAGVERVVTGHCTGEQASELLRETFGENLSELRSGSAFTW
jgi:7,8-dihydropterin-6-yl-methyl-4-(beta-D-ribofuranosyl)aminobenzene 5'-phosphate synthase